ncbi:similar to Saccharomyces cerevisiae YAL051W OAF1 Oleate-activated transcription factor, acts alone and as a heterodimer with Pip2p [Maudiozyma saulgeensis]|uniref:Similar to Saccharomyces cerevisiae YAL051W OAF1 Oleate-activated transcription factor, acts alone and as a heterodimer with Pip2p n=1 Tax=Maudiozyma saulgeensis TaxID=1789683 RepID=A0A1X7R4V6_9SACH|nr:similar to Saccharomyces cerevisiae YAL051W OAF1 Oleate-activated transcription factor, acts alone and as a heterodimer with Pip2p [Kazachstania saulgeensis]
MSENITKIAKKRNRLSFVCQACRRSKTKCDKLKPKCSRCKNQDLSCVYDIAIQTRPKCASRKSQIQMLDNELDFWKKKTNQLMKLQYKKIIESKQTHLFGDLEVLPERDLTNNKRTVKDFWDLNVNIYRDDTNLIISPIMKTEVTPLSENNIIINDHFIITLIISVIATSNENVALLPAYAAEPNMVKYCPSVVNTILKNKDILVKHCQNTHEKRRIEYFTNKLLQIPISHKNSVRLESFLADVNKDLSYPYLEDHCTLEGGYSELLESFIDSYEQLLPPYDVILHYKAHFYENIYPCLPFLDKNSFEKMFKSIVFKDPNNLEKIKLNFGTSGLRGKIETMCLLSIILKLSYMSLMFINEKDIDAKNISSDILKKYPISNKTISLIQKCAVSENWIACPNENIVACLLYMWSYLVFSPEEGDFFTANPTDVLCNLIIMLSTTIGLHRDPSDFRNLDGDFNRELRNHRRLLWLCVVGMSGIEVILKGRRGTSKSFMASFIDIDDPNVMDQYMKRVKNDMEVPDAFVLKLHENTFKYAYLVSLHQRISDCFLKYSGTFKLREINELKEKIDAFIKKEFPLESRAENLKDLNINTTNDDIINQLSLITTKNSANFLYTVLSKLIMLRVSLALLFHFEKCCVQQKKDMKAANNKDYENNIDYLPYYYHYLKESVCYTVLLSNYIGFFYDKGNSNVISPLTTYHMSKIIQLSLSTVLLTALSTGLKVHVSINEVMSSPTSVIIETSEKIQLLSELEVVMRTALFRTYNLVSENLRFTYYPVFKMLVLFDVFMVKYKKDELLPNYFKSLDTGLQIERREKLFGLTFNYKLEKGEKMIDDIRDRNLIGNFSCDQLKSILEKIHQTNLDIIPDYSDQDVNSIIDNNPPMQTHDNNSNESSGTPMSEINETQIPIKAYYHSSENNGLPTNSNINNTVDMINQSYSNETQLPNFPASMAVPELPENMVDINNIGFNNEHNNNNTNNPNKSMDYNTFQNPISLASDDTLEFANLFGDVDIFGYDFFFGTD